MSDNIITFEAPDPGELSRLLSSYEVTALIAQGGMGAVYQAVQTSLDRPVAIKLLPKELGDDEFRAQFGAEAKAMARLNHPNLIGIYDFGEVEGMPYIVMELVEGKSLYYSCYQKAIEQSEAVRLVTEISFGLAHAHEHGIVHRDIKPANILLDGGAHAKIGDFGLASGETPSEAGLVYGTPGYAAPEITQDPEHVGIQSDIFAVGVILHQLLTGNMPDDDARPASRQAKCHPQLDRVIRKATHQNPASRYATCDELIADLAEVPALKSLKTATAIPAQVRAPKKTLVAGTAANSKTPATPSMSEEVTVEDKPPVVIAMQPSTNWPLIRNLMIIALLIPALIFAVGKLKDKQEREEQALSEKQKEENADKALRKANAEKSRKEAEERARVTQEKANRRKKQQASVEKVMEKEVPKTPREQLSELQGELRGGSRSKFPEGTIKRGTDHFFLIEEPMSWSEASELAETYGGHLATPILDSDLSWIGSNHGDTRRSWIGGGALGNNAWGWVTGADWNHSTPSTTIGSCAAVTRTGILNARPNGEKLPFFIQWTADGLNKGSLAAQLERLKGTLGAPSPAWPPGTLASQGRAYLLVQRAGAWEDADIIAVSSGGHLAVSSDGFEREYLRKTITDYLGKGQAAWLGGRLVKGTWTWTTREIWQQPDWGSDSPNGEARDSALRFIVDGAKSGWDDASPVDESAADAFIIEWSQDFKKAPKAGSATDAGAKNNEIKDLRIRGARYLAKVIGEHRKRLLKNQKDYQWHLDSWFRNKPKSFNMQFQGAKDAMSASLPDDGTLPDDLPIAGLPAEAHEDLAKARARQKRYDLTLQKDISDFRDAYLGKLLAARKQAEDAGLKTQLPVFDEEIKSIGQNVESFRAHFGMEE